MAKDFVSHKPKPTAVRSGIAPVKPVKASSPAPPPAAKPAPAAEANAKGKAIDPKDPSTWPKEVGGPSGPEPTRYGDWERKGICSDF